ncbi:MAG: M23 family metallopeptidase [Clostridia bacterium]|nr:M23 family metallopeptidase [Clostridia bacterium]
MKKIYVIIVCVLLAFIPTYIAFASYFATQVQPVKQDTVDRIEIVTPTGITSEVNRENDTAGFIEFAVSMNENAEKILGLPDPLIDDPYFKFTYFSFDKSTVYKYYFDSNSADAYFVDPAGLAYHIKKESAEEFLKTSYAHCIYDYSSAPVFTLNSTSILPSKSNWQFKGFNDEFCESVSTPGTNDLLETYGTPSFNFDIEPDTVTVTLTENGETLFDGYHTELSNNNFSGRTADAHIVATWYDSPDRDYRGELKYDLKLLFKEPPVFFISDTSAITGDIITLSVLNAEDPSAINFTSEPAISITPKFYSDGDYARALIPVSSELVPGTYKFTADYNGQSLTEFSLDISSNYTDSYPYNIEETLFSSIYNDANIQAYNKLFNSFFADLSAERMFDGKFISGLPAGTFESADYCDLLTISQNDVPFENPGVYYSCTKASDISAVNAGKVIYAGTDTLAGNIVAVDHGMGLISVYKHLGSISVKAGDMLEKGALIGVSGRTGLMSKKSAHISVARVELYISGVAVDIDPLIASGIVTHDHS